MKKVGKFTCRKKWESWFTVEVVRTISFLKRYGLDSRERWRQGWTNGQKLISCKVSTPHISKMTGIQENGKSEIKRKCMLKT